MEAHYNERPCPECGHSQTLCQECTGFCGGAYAPVGWHDEWETDAINYAPGQELRRCTRCWGTGFEAWCPECGCDLNRHAYLRDRKRAEHER